MNARATAARLFFVAWAFAAAAALVPAAACSKTGPLYLKILPVRQ